MYALPSDIKNGDENKLISADLPNVMRSSVASTLYFQTKDDLTMSRILRTISWSVQFSCLTRISRDYEYNEHTELLANLHKLSYLNSKLQ